MRFTFPLIALAAIAAPVAATEQVVDVRINIAGVDAKSVAGRAEIEARIDAKLREACKVESPYSYRKSIVDQSCVADARAQALAEVERIAASGARAGGQLAAN